MQQLTNSYHLKSVLVCSWEVLAQWFNRHEVGVEVLAAQ